MRWYLVVLLASCTVEEKIDAPDFSCEAVPPPTTAPNFVRVRGIVRNLAGDNALPGVIIEGSASGRPLGEITTDANGEFEFSHETGGVPNFDSVSGTAPGFLKTVAYPGAAIFEDSFVEVRMLEMTTVIELAMNAGIALDFTKGTALVRVTDCNESPVAGGKLEVPVGASVIYFRFAAPDKTAIDTDLSGIALVTGLPVGLVTLRGSVGDVVLRDNEIETEVDVPMFAQTLARP